MEFVTRKRNRPVVPIISLIDILAILLIFFVATSTFREKKTAMKINLPTSGTLGTPLVRDVSGELAVQSEEEITFNGAPTTLSELPDQLRLFKKTQPERKVELLADQEIPLRVMVAVWDALTQAGFRINEVPTRIQTPAADTPATTN
jgi:biopolymer transport protein ExbD